MRALLLIACLSLLAGCTSAPVTYHAPDDAKVRAATTDLNIKVDRARETARRSKKAGEEAKAIHDRMIKNAGTVKELLDKLAIRLPEEYKGPLREISNVVDDLLGQNAELARKLNELTAWNLQLETELNSAEKSRVTLQKAQDEYAGGAAGLAEQATNESRQRYEAQRQLVKEKWIRLLWKIGGGFMIAALLLVLALWWFGKLGAVGLKIASKLP